MQILYVTYPETFLFSKVLTRIVYTVNERRMYFGIVDIIIFLLAYFIFRLQLQKITLHV